MIASDVGIGSNLNDMSSNEDSYATGDARLPSVMGVVRRPGMEPKKKKRKKQMTKFQEKFAEEVNRPVLIDGVTRCYTIINSKNFMPVAENLVNTITKEYNKDETDNGEMVLSFEANDELFKEYVGKVRGLFNDRINKNIFVYLEKSELNRGTDEEMEHTDTIKDIQANKKMKVRQAARKIAKDHVKEDPKYYTKLKKYVG